MIERRSVNWAKGPMPGKVSDTYYSICPVHTYTKCVMGGNPGYRN